jgi:hypothetical protein
MALALGEDGNENVGAGDLLPSGRLDVDYRPLDDTLEPCRGLRVLATVRNEVCELRVDILDQVPAKNVDVDVTRAHDGSRILIVDQSKQQMFQGRIFVSPLPRQGEGTVESLFKTARETRQGFGVLPRPDAIRGRIGIPALLYRIVSQNPPTRPFPCHGTSAGAYFFSITHCSGCWCFRAKSITCVTLVSATS